jgi:hypothetical protein
MILGRNANTSINRELFFVGIIGAMPTSHKQQFSPHKSGNSTIATRTETIPQTIFSDATHSQPIHISFFLGFLFCFILLSRRWKLVWFCNAGNEFSIEEITKKVDDARYSSQQESTRMHVSCI